MSHAAAREIAPGSVGAWILASRPATLTAAATPVFVGSACAFHAGSFRAGPALAALTGALLIQIGTNFANDLFDYERGADTKERIGPTRVTQSGLLTPTQVRKGMWTTFALAATAGGYLTYVAGWPVLAIGLLSIASGIAYTSGPYPLGYSGLGDLFVFLFFGFVAVCGTAFVQTGLVPLPAILASIPIGALCTAILVVNNVRDCETDRRSGKRTIVVRFGRNSGRAEFAALLALSYLAPALFLAAGIASAQIFLPLATLPLAARTTRTVLTSTDGPALNRSLKQTARLLFLYGILLSAGISWGAPN